MERKETRRITHHTFDDQQSNRESWYSSAISFHEGARILGQNVEAIHGGVRVFLTNTALSIELLLKAIVVAQGGIARTDHKLPDLALDAGVAFTNHQKATLELLSEILIWSGRYPVPKTARAWDHYYNNVHERHVIRERAEGAWIVRANPETFPSISKCEEVWNLAHERWAEIQRQG